MTLDEFDQQESRLRAELQSMSREALSSQPQAIVGKSLLRAPIVLKPSSPQSKRT